MLAQLAIVAYIVTLVSVEKVSALKCYSCAICSSPLNPKTETVSGCTACSTTKGYVAGTVTLLTRSCETTCTPTDTLVLGTGLVRTCCQTDLCNTDAAASLTPWKGVICVLLASIGRYFLAT
ncbi:unnamed protein product [Dicrocoelium dendriticum]|nr:unnamed protein product [Dicrocoelium dendriticum]